MRFKDRYLAITLGLVLGTSIFTGCGTLDSGSADSAGGSAGILTETAGQTVYGEIADIDGNTLTLNVGTVPETESGQGSQSDTENDSENGNGTETTAETTAAVTENGTDSSTAEAKDGQSQTTEQKLEMTGETLDVTIDDNVKITDVSEMAGEMGQDGQTPPEKPSGDSSQGTSSGDSTQSSGQNAQTPPEKPSGDSSQGTSSGDGTQSSGQNAQTPPEKPSGDSSQGTSSGDNSTQSSGQSTQTPPEKPSGDSSDQSAAGDASSSGNESGQAPQNMEMNGTEITKDDLEEGDIVEITFDDEGDPETIEVTTAALIIMEQNQPGQGGNGQNGGVENYAAVNTCTEDTDLSKQELSSTGTDENAVLVQQGAKVTVSDCTVSRDSDDSTGGDNASFYGVGAAVLTTDGTVSVSDSKITTDAAGGAGVFAYGDGVAKVSNTTISTKQDTSGGIHVAGGGTLTAKNCKVTTNGESSAAIRSDRGGGKITVKKGSYTSNGKGSPAIYSTADITASKAKLKANGSEAVCIEGDNSVRLTDCTLSGNMPDDSQNDCTWNVILYQSMSGDSEEGNSTFTMDGGKLTAKNGGMFYTTNTESSFTLKDVDITYADENDFFLKCTGNSNQRGWGSAGSNGADTVFTGIDQQMEGNVIWDSISSLDFYMSGSSTLKGAVVDDESNAGDGGDGSCSMYIDQDSTWVVTGDSSVTALCNAGTIQDADGNTVSVVGTDGTQYVKGSSQYVITVNSYSEEADMSGASDL